MAHRALYRKLRPQRFADLVGQEHVRRALRNAVSQEQVAHAYLLSGPHGTGKTTVARIFAKAVNCAAPTAGEPCLECPACESIAQATTVDVLEIDAASHRGVDDMRDLREQVRYAPSALRYKVYIVDEVHMLTSEAFHALLKTLEEPPPHTLFVLATTDPYRLPPTILSRCQRLAFFPLKEEDVGAYLTKICASQGRELEPLALQLLVQTAAGSLRDGLSLLEQALMYGEERVSAEWVRQLTGGVAPAEVVRLWEAWAKAEKPTLLHVLQELAERGHEPERLGKEVLRVARTALQQRILPSAEGEVAQGEAFPDTEELLLRTDALLQALSSLRGSPLPAIALELALLKTCSVGTARPPAVSVPSSTPAAPPSPPLSAAESRPIAQSPTEPSEAVLPARTQALLEQLAARVERLENRNVTPELPGLKQEKEANAAIFAAVDWRAASATPALREVQPQWAKVLQAIRRESIRLHAWLVDSRLVAATEEAVVIALASEVHCTTVRRTDHRTQVERILAEVVGRSFRVETVIASTWREAMREEGAGRAPAGKEEPAQDRGAGPTEPAREQGSKANPPSEEPSWQQAHELFGDSDLVVLDEKER